MAKNVVIRDVVYSEVPKVQIPLSSGSGSAESSMYQIHHLIAGTSFLKGRPHMVQVESRSLEPYRADLLQILQPPEQQ